MLLGYFGFKTFRRKIHILFTDHYGCKHAIYAEVTASANGSYASENHADYAYCIHFLFMGFPSGLVLYWTVNNLLSMAQQWFVNRQLINNKISSRLL